MAVGLVITPSLEKSLIQRRGIVTVPDEDATISCECVSARPCNGLTVRELPLEARTLESHMRMMGDKFVSRMRARGLEWVGGDLRLHGPWPSYEFNRTMADVESSMWRQAESEDEPRHVLPMVIERAPVGGYSDYLLVGDFLATNVWTEMEESDVNGTG